jgi:hypothetical protein
MDLKDVDLNLLVVLHRLLIERRVSRAEPLVAYRHRPALCSRASSVSL